RPLPLAATAVTTLATTDFAAHRGSDYPRSPSHWRIHVKSRFIMSAAAGLAAVLALTGCGGTEPAKDGKVTLKMGESLTNPTRTDTLKKLISGFEQENPNIKVDLISPPTDQADQKIQQMLQSGKGIDVVEARDITVGSFGANEGR